MYEQQKFSKLLKYVYVYNISHVLGLHIIGFTLSYTLECLI